MAHKQPSYHSNTTFSSLSTRGSWLMAAAAAAVLSLSACGSLKPKESAAYKDAQVVNPLEVPPDLTRANSNAGNRIPAPEGEQVSAEDNDTFGEFKKYKEWEDFEAFRAWKQQQGDDDLSFEAYQRSRQSDQSSQAGQTALASPSDVAVITDEENQKYLRIEDVEENVWTRLAVSFENIGANILERDRRKGYYIVRFDADDSTSLVSRFFSTSGERSLRVQLLNDGPATNVLIQKKSGKPSSSDRADQLLGELTTQLRTWAAGV